MAKYAQISYEDTSHMRYYRETYEQILLPSDNLAYLHYTEGYLHYIYQFHAVMTEFYLNGIGTVRNRSSDVTRSSQ